MIAIASIIVICVVISLSVNQPDKKRTALNNKESYLTYGGDESFDSGLSQIIRRSINNTRLLFTVRVLFH